MIAAAALLLAGAANHSAEGKTGKAVDFSSVSDGIRSATAVIQKAIDDCAAAGGGEVLVPPGNYLCKTVFLRSGVTLRLTRGATIIGDKDYESYPAHSLIYAEDVSNAGICGEGTIDGNANYDEFKAKGYKDNDKIRVHAIYFLRCKDMSVRDIHIYRSAFWTFKMRECEKMFVDGVTINCMEFINCDGIDIDAKDVVISNCIIDSDDDAICLKSDNADFIPENISITNCVLSSNSNGIKFGTSSKGGFRNVTITNCAIRPAYKSVRRKIWTEYRNIPEGTTACHSGISIECVDGGLVENISISNIAMEGIVCPIFLCINMRSGKLGTLRNVNISNITAIAEGVIPCIMSGVPEGKIQDVSLSNINIIRKSWDVEQNEPVKENYKSYPECRMYGHKIPAYGLYARHIEGLRVNGFRISTPAEEQRPCIVLDDVSGEDLSGVNGVSVRK